MLATRLVLVLALVLVATACSPNEEELQGLRSCGELAGAEGYGNTREIPEADVTLFSRPGRYSGAEAAALTGLEGEVQHVSRSIGPCGQQDLFVSLSADAVCVAVEGRGWRGSTCWDEVTSPALLRVPVDGFSGEVMVTWAPGSDRSHVLAETASGLSVAAFVRGGAALMTLPEEVRGVHIVDFDGAQEVVSP